MWSCVKPTRRPKQSSNMASRCWKLMRWTTCWYMAQLFSPCRCLSRCSNRFGRNHRLQSSQRWRAAVQRMTGLCDGEPRLSSLAPFPAASCGLADSLDELRPLLQGRTVLRVVGQGLLLPAGLPDLLPACPPHQALESRGVHLGPNAAQVAADL